MRKKSTNVAVIKVEIIIWKLIFVFCRGTWDFLMKKSSIKKIIFEIFISWQAKKSKKLDFWHFLMTNLKKYFFRFFGFCAAELLFSTFWCKKQHFWFFFVIFEKSKFQKKAKTFLIFFSLKFFYFFKFLPTKII